MDNQEIFDSFINGNLKWAIDEIKALGPRVTLSDFLAWVQDNHPAHKDRFALYLVQSLES